MWGLCSSFKSQLLDLAARVFSSVNRAQETVHRPAAVSIGVVSPYIVRYSWHRAPDRGGMARRLLEPKPAARRVQIHAFRGWISRACPPRPRPAPPRSSAAACAPASSAPAVAAAVSGPRCASSDSLGLQCALRATQRQVGVGIMRGPCASAFWVPA